MLKAVLKLFELQKQVVEDPSLENASQLPRLRPPTSPTVTPVLAHLIRREFATICQELLAVDDEVCLVDDEDENHRVEEYQSLHPPLEWYHYDPELDPAVRQSLAKAEASAQRLPELTRRGVFLREQRVKELILASKKASSRIWGHRGKGNKSVRFAEETEPPSSNSTLQPQPRHAAASFDPVESEAFASQSRDRSRGLRVQARAVAEAAAVLEARVPTNKQAYSPLRPQGPRRSHSLINNKRASQHKQDDPRSESGHHESVLVATSTFKVSAQRPHEQERAEQFRKLLLLRRVMSIDSDSDSGSNNDSDRDCYSHNIEGKAGKAGKGRRLRGKTVTSVAKVSAGAASRRAGLRRLAAATEAAAAAARYGPGRCGPRPGVVEAWEVSSQSATTEGSDSDVDSEGF